MSFFEKNLNLNLPWKCFSMIVAVRDNVIYKERIQKSTASILTINKKADSLGNISFVLIFLIQKRMGLGLLEIQVYYGSYKEVYPLARGKEFRYIT